MYSLYGFIISNAIWSLSDKVNRRQKTLESYALIQWTVADTHALIQWNVADTHALIQWTVADTRALIQWNVADTHVATEEICDAATESD